jgi:hypothetical protein
MSNRTCACVSMVSVGLLLHQDDRHAIIYAL